MVDEAKELKRRPMEVKADSKLVYHALCNIFKSDKAIQKLIEQMRTLLSFADAAAVKRLKKYLAEVLVPNLAEKINCNQQTKKLFILSTTNTFDKLLKQADFAGEHILKTLESNYMLHDARFSANILPYPGQDLHTMIRANKKSLLEFASTPIPELDDLRLFKDSPKAARKFEAFFDSLESKFQIASHRDINKLIALPIIGILAYYAYSAQDENLRTLLRMALVLVVFLPQLKAPTDLIRSFSPIEESKIHKLYSIQSIEAETPNIDQGLNIKFTPLPWVPPQPSLQSIASDSKTKPLTPLENKSFFSSDPYGDMMRSKTERYTPNFYSSQPEKKSSTSKEKLSISDTQRKAFANLGLYHVWNPDFKELLFIRLDPHAINKTKMGEEDWDKLTSLLKTIEFKGQDDDENGIKKLKTSRDKKYHWEISILGSDKRALSTGEIAEETVLGKKIKVMEFSKLAETHDDLKRQARLGK